MRNFTSRLTFAVHTKTPNAKSTTRKTMTDCHRTGQAKRYGAIPHTADRCRSGLRNAQNTANRGLAVMLIPARTDTKAFHEYIYGKAEIRFVKGRLHFVKQNGENTDSAPFPSMVVIFKPK